MQPKAENEVKVCKSVISSQGEAAGKRILHEGPGNSASEREIKVQCKGWQVCRLCVWVVQEW